MLLIELCLRWLLPASFGMGPPAARVIPAPIAMKDMATQHHTGLALIHALPPWLSLH